MRYIGTKHWLSPLVRSALLSVTDQGPVADVFAGMASVASAVSDARPVIANDVMSFTAFCSEARLVDVGIPASFDLLSETKRVFSEHRARLRTRFARRLAGEGAALRAARGPFRSWLETAPHAGSSSHYRKLADAAARAAQWDRWQLATLYFSGGYFSTAQAIDLDALRCAIDSTASGAQHTRLIAAWLESAAAIINAPGHSAQYLKPTTVQVASRIKRQWARDVWDEFGNQLRTIERAGTRSSRNRVTTMDALEFLGSTLSREVRGVYADPPYTRHDYSRYYHVYETLLRYDYPVSVGAGRYRSPRRTSDFSRASRVSWAFNELSRRVAELQIPLIISYPDNGLLCQRGLRPETILLHHFRSVSRVRLRTAHSSLAGGPHSTKESTEWLLIARPQGRS